MHTGTLVVNPTELLMPYMSPRLLIPGLRTISIACSLHWVGFLFLFFITHHKETAQFRARSKYSHGAKKKKKVQMSLSPVMSLVCINEISVYNDSVSNRPVSHTSLDLKSFTWRQFCSFIKELGHVMAINDRLPSRTKSHEVVRVD